MVSTEVKVSPSIKIYLSVVAVLAMAQSTEYDGFWAEFAQTRSIMLSISAIKSANQDKLRVSIAVSGGWPMALDLRALDQRPAGDRRLSS